MRTLLSGVSPKIKDRIEGRRFLFVKGRKLTMSAFYTKAREGASCGVVLLAEKYL